MRIFHIGYKKLDEENLKGQNVEYTFFNSKSFIDEDNIIGMWDRIFHLLESAKSTTSHIILFEVYKPGLINSREEENLRRFGLVIKLPYGRQISYHNS